VWAGKVSEEFALQLELEKQLGLPVSTFMQVHARLWSPPARHRPPHICVDRVPPGSLDTSALSCALILPAVSLRLFAAVLD